MIKKPAMLAIKVSKECSLEFFYVDLQGKYGNRNVEQPRKREI